MAWVGHKAAGVGGREARRLGDPRQVAGREMTEKMRLLDVRRGALSGAVVLIVLSCAVAAQSDNPPAAFVETMVVGLVMMALAIGALLVVNRRRRGSAGQ